MKQKSLTKNRIIKVLLGVIVLLLLIVGTNFILSLSKSNKANSQVEQSDQDKKTFTLSQLGHINAEKKRLKVSFGPAYYVPTGLYVEPGQEIVITLNENDQFNQPRLIISPPVLTKPDDAISDGFKLKKGRTEMTTVRGGILYLVNSSHESDIPAEVTIEGASTLPTFELGKTTKEQWGKLLAEHRDAPAFELVSDKVTITAGMEYTDLVTDPEKLLIKHDEAVDVQAKASGLDEADPNPVHHPTQFPYHFRHSDESGIWMYAWFNHTAYQTQTLNKLLDIDEFITSGWGPWHELGHVHQQGATTPGMFGEVTNNVFSMTVQRQFEQPSNLEESGNYESAFAYLKGSADDYPGLDDMEKLVMLWQLDLTYGDDLFPSLYRMVREMDDNELPTSDEEKIQKFVYWTSMIAEQNLIPFYERWGLTVEKETRQDILELDYPELIAPIWWNRDSNNTIRSFDTTIPSVLETLHAYEKELPVDVYALLDKHLTNAGKDEADDVKFSEHIEEITLLLNSQKDEKVISEMMYEIMLSQVNLLNKK